VASRLYFQRAVPVCGCVNQLTLSAPLVITKSIGSNLYPFGSKVMSWKCPLGFEVRTKKSLDSNIVQLMLMEHIHFYYCPLPIELISKPVVFPIFIALRWVQYSTSRVGLPHQYSWLVGPWRISEAQYSRKSLGTWVIVSPLN